MDQAITTVRPEPQLGEDAEVAADVGGAALTFEVQAKDEAGGLDLAGLARHLAHCPPHQTGDTFFERLAADPSRRAIFVISGRCADWTAPFAAAAGWKIDEARTTAITISAAGEFLDAFGKVPIIGGRYEPARQAHRTAVATTMAKAAARDALARVTILERAPHSDLIEDCKRQISDRLRLPPMAAGPVLQELLGLVRNAKRSGDDVMPGLRAACERHHSARIGSRDYVARGAEAIWSDMLQRDHMLLFAGPPRAGKTEAAEHIAGAFQSRGYEVRRAFDIEAVQRLIYDDASTPRVLLLDDPLGDDWGTAETPAAYDRLRRVLPQLNARRLLIVAQSSNPLLRCAAVPTVAQVVTAGRRWIDLGEADSVFLSNVWKSKAQQSSEVPRPAIDRLAKALEGRTVYLDLGALQHLAFSSQIDEQSSVADMVALADEDALAFGQRIVAAEPSLEKLLVGLGLATDANSPISEETLAFVVTDGATDLPGRLSTPLRITNFMGNSGAPSRPIYATPPTMGVAMAGELERLENRRVVVRAGEGELAMAHGFYHAAALGLLRAPAKATVARHLTMLRRGLFCLGPKSSRATARNLPRVFGAMPDEKSRREVLKIASEGMSSIFPGTRDLCLRFLLAELRQMDAAMRSSLPRWLDLAYATDLDDIVWMDGEAWLPDPGVESSPSSAWLAAPPKFSEVKADIEALVKGDQSSVAPERAATLLRYYASAPSRLTKTAAARLLALDEAVLRGEVGRIWTAARRADDADILERLFEDPHPTIARQLLDGVAAGWSKYAPARRNILVGHLKQLATNPSVALPLVNRLVLIDRVEHFGPAPPWPLFGELLPNLLDQIPAAARGVEQRLFDSLDHAVDHLSAEQVVAVCGAWLRWLVRMSKGTLGTDCAWGVVPILLRATTLRPELRNGLFEPLFKLKGSAAAVMLVKEFVENWEVLTARERAVLTKKLLGDRKDRNWLQAVALTAYDVPPEVEMLILGAAMAKEPAALIAQLPANLLAACIDVFLGTQPFWWLGLQHRSEALWSSVVDHLAAEPDKVVGRRCMYDLVRHEKVERLMAALPAWADHLDDVFEMLVLHRLASSGGRVLKPAWEAIFEKATPAQAAKWRERLASLAPAMVDSLREFRDELGLNLNDTPEFFGPMAPDFQVLDLVIRILKISEGQSDLLPVTFDAVAEVIKANPPILFGTYEYVHDALRTPENKDHPFFKALTGHRSVALQARSKQRDAEGPSELVIERDDWIGRM